jgi:hypothetical protein
MSIASIETDIKITRLDRPKKILSIVTKETSTSIIVFAWLSKFLVLDDSNVLHPHLVVIARVIVSVLDVPVLVIGRGKTEGRIVNDRTPDEPLSIGTGVPDFHQPPRKILRTVLDRCSLAFREIVLVVQVINQFAAGDHDLFGQRALCVDSTRKAQRKILVVPEPNERKKIWEGFRFVGGKRGPTRPARKV